jgi:AcrR family transcriptional regulator
VVYEHFGGKEGLYAVVVDREMTYLVAVHLRGRPRRRPRRPNGKCPRPARAGWIRPSSTTSSSTRMAFASWSGTSPSTQEAGRSSAAVQRVASPTSSSTSPLCVQAALGQFEAHGISPEASHRCTRRRWWGWSPSRGQWWLDVRKPKRTRSALAHLVDARLAWAGAHGIPSTPTDEGLFLKSSKNLDVEES